MPDNIMGAPIFIIVSGSKHEIGAGEAFLIPKILMVRATPVGSEGGHGSVGGTTGIEVEGVVSPNPEQ
jgi:hypothetical protein